MGKASSRKQGRSPNTNKNKGNLVEDIVAMFHDDPNVQVLKQVKLPGSRGGTIKREIDVLVTAGVVGYEVRIAFECKNEAKPIGSKYIDSFRGKLDYIGIPRQHGVFVSATGYTKGALEAAEDAGITALTLKGLRPDRLAPLVLDAFQHVVWLLPTITELRVTNEIAEARSIKQQGEMWVFKDEDGHVCGTVPDLVWHKWVSGSVPSILGEHELDLRVPSHWKYVVDGKDEPLLGIGGKVQVVGLIVTRLGTATSHMLLNAGTKEVFKQNLSMSFDVPREPLPVTMVETEDDLEKYIHKQNSVNLTVGRFRLPRMKWEAMYYPPSERVARLTILPMRAFAEGKIPDPRPFKFEELEGTNMATVFEPIWDEHPAVKKGDRINWVNP